MTTPQTTPDTPEIPTPIHRNGIPTQPAWLLSILVALASVAFCLSFSAVVGKLPEGMPTPVSEGIPLVISIVLMIYLFRICRGHMRWAPGLLLFFGALLTYLSASAHPATLLLTPIFAISMGALLVATAPRRTLLYLPLIPLAAYGISLLLCQEGRLALACLVPFPAAVALALGTQSSATVHKENGLSRVGVLCATSFCFGLSLAGIAMLLISMAGGSLTPSFLLQLIESWRTACIDGLLAAYALLPEIATEGLQLTPAQAADMVNGVFNLLPAIAVVLSNLICALAQAVLFAGLTSFGYADTVKGRVRLLRMSLVSDVVFLLSCAVLLVAGTVKNSDVAGIAATVAENIALILIPGLALCGLMRILYGLIRRRRAGCFPMFLLLVLPCLLLYATSLLAFYEAGAALISAFLSRRNPRDGEGRGGRPPYDTGAGAPPPSDTDDTPPEDP